MNDRSRRVREKYSKKCEESKKIQLWTIESFGFNALAAAGVRVCFMICMVLERDRSDFYSFQRHASRVIATLFQVLDARAVQKPTLRSFVREQRSRQVPRCTQVCPGVLRLSALKVRGMEAMDAGAITTDTKRGIYLPIAFDCEFGSFRVHEALSGAQYAASRLCNGTLSRYGCRLYALWISSVRENWPVQVIENQ